VLPLRILSDVQFKELSTEQKYLYINEMLHYIVASRPRPKSNGRLPVGQHLESVAQRLTDADYSGLTDSQKIRYLENLISELISTVSEAQHALGTLRAASSPPR
jgi:hypothetical protein